tara:strand:+ start:96 stop:827 length:732 start_codon:yes stop_codon:yes gene_type:complete
MSKEIKVIGIQRSGTNYLSTILEINYDITSVDTGRDRLPDGSRKYFWKHSYDPEQYECGTDNDHDVVASGLKRVKEKKIPTILITKNPYFWLESIKRSSGDIGMKGIPHIKWKRIAIREDHPQTVRLPPGRFDLENVCKMWVDFHSYWINNSFPNLLCVRYEDLLADPDKVLQRIEKQFKIRRKQEETKLPERVVMSNSFDKKRIPRYIAEKQPHISEEEKSMMSSVLTKQILSHYGYGHCLQ